MIPPESSLKPSQLKLLYQIITELPLAAFAAMDFLFFFVLQRQSHTWWSLNAMRIPSSCHVSFHLTCVTTVSTLALSNATGMQLRWCAWTPHRWIVINYHQEELSGWCNTVLGISHRDFRAVNLLFDQGKADFWQHDVPGPKLHDVTLNIAGHIKKSCDGWNTCSLLNTGKSFWTDNP